MPSLYHYFLNLSLINKSLRPLKNILKVNKLENSKKYKWSQNKKRQIS